MDPKENVEEDSEVDPSLEETHHDAADEPVVEVAVGGQEGGDELPVPSAVARRPAPAKEVCPFRWKLIGESKGAILTLFKSADRLEVESQRDRALADAYYSNLRIVEIDEKTVQPPSAARVPEPKPLAEAKAPPLKVKSSAEATPGKTPSAGSDKAKAPKKAAVKPAQAQKTGKPSKPTPKTPKSAGAKKAGKVDASPKGKKKPARKSAAKRTAKKK